MTASTDLSDDRPGGGASGESRVGEYRLLAPLGEGGMGVVHLAQAPDGRRVALKVLRPHVVGDAEARERLAREIRSLKRIASVRIAEILDADSHGPTPYVVTRYVPGLSLYHHVAEEGIIEGADLLHFADALAEALQAVHAVGVLHRDVKPTNVLMEGRSPVLIDFGLARVAEDSRLTQTGWLMGTPGYLAPEILYGDEATAASDVHAWAATVAFAATGRPPYGKGPTMAVLDRVRRGEHDLSEVPEELRGLLSECLAPEPHERPTVAEIRTTLRAQRERVHLRAAPVVAPEQWTMPFAPASTPTDTGHDPDPAAPSAAPNPTAFPGEVVREVPPAVPGSTPVQEPPTRILPAQQGHPAPGPTPAPTPAAAPVVAPAGQLGPSYAPPTREDRFLRVLQLLGLGVLAGAMIAYAPYAGTALVGLVVLGLRTASVTRQRHGRRLWLRGRRRWYDVPATTLSTPGYAVLALFGTISLVAFAALAALAMFSLGYLFGQPPRISLVLAGLGAVPALWWGPGAGRVREVTRRLVVRNGRTEFGGWFLVVMCGLGAAVLLGLLFNGGANWTPAVGAP